MRRGKTGVRNNFSLPQVRERSSYKLWVKYSSYYINEKLSRIKVYYSYEKPGNPRFGYNKLTELAGKIKHKIDLAILYDNHTGKELERYEYSPQRITEIKEDFKNRKDGK
jgi:hypothetical protein